MLRIGSFITSKTGQVFFINNFLGSGGQGEVYEVENMGKKYALKWYYPNIVTQLQKRNIENLISKGSPNNRFLWPLEIIYMEGQPTFGYIMPLRSEEYKSISDMMARKIDPTFKAVCNAAINLVDSYLELHAKGLCYKDISFGNIFINPQNGDIRICDNDNISITGLEGGSVVGTQRFMAPEIVIGRANPSTETDLYSLSVLLFYMFMLHHPLEGRKIYDLGKFDEEAAKKIYGYEPLFIWNPYDFSNRPIKPYQSNAIIYWSIYPEFIRDLFTRAFTKGLKNPQNRVLETEWKKSFTKLRDQLRHCDNCGVEIFYDEVKIKDGETHRCWACNKQLKLSPMLENNESENIGDYIGEQKTLNLIWIVDCSGSMTGQKIQALNYAIKNSISSIKELTSKNRNIKVFIKAIKFSSEAMWHIKEDIELANFLWNDLETGGLTQLGEALMLVSEEIEKLESKDNVIPPILILISDGQPTDSYKIGLNRLLKSTLGKNAIKLSIAIGEDADKEVLQEFIDSEERLVLEANNAHELVDFIKLASVETVKKSLML